MFWFELSSLDNSEELLKWVGDEQDNEEIDADVENFVDLVIRERARLVRLLFFLVGTPFVDEKDDCSFLSISFVVLTRITSSDAPFKIPIVPGRVDRNLLRPIEFFLVFCKTESVTFVWIFLLIRFFAKVGRINFRKDRIILLFKWVFFDTTVSVLPVFCSVFSSNLIFEILLLVVSFSRFSMSSVRIWGLVPSNANWLIFSTL